MQLLISGPFYSLNYYSVELKIPRFIQQKLASCKSEEARTQQDRENTVLAAVYFEDRHIPPSPSEMDVDGPRTTAPPLRIIPMHDTTVIRSSNILNSYLTHARNPFLSSNPPSNPQSIRTSSINFYPVS